MLRAGCPDAIQKEIIRRKSIIKFNPRHMISKHRSKVVENIREIDQNITYKANQVLLENTYGTGEQVGSDLKAEIERLATQTHPD
jgi:hypothetical protein